MYQHNAVCGHWSARGRRKRTAALLAIFAAQENIYEQAKESERWRESQTRYLGSRGRFDPRGLGNGTAYRASATLLPTILAKLIGSESSAISSTTSMQIIWLTGDFSG